MDAFSSPWLFADRCVLRRLLVPRHSPCALCSLTISSTRRKFVVYPNLPFRITIRYLALFSFQDAFFDLMDLKVQKIEFGGLKSRVTLCLLAYVFLDFRLAAFAAWWAQVDSNHRPHAYQACALTS